MTADDDDNHDFTEPTPVIDTVKKLIIEAKKFKSFTSLVHLHALKQFIELWDKYKWNPRIKAPMMKSSHAFAVSIGKGPYMARKIRTLYKYVARFHTLPPVSAGKHHGHPSLLNNECIAQAVRHYLTVLADGEITPLLLMRQVNTVIIPSLGLNLNGQKISEGSARRWLAKLGYELKEVKKGVYVDGHEREDVVAYRKQFLEQFAANERFRRTYRDEDLEPVEPTLGHGEKLHVPVMHNESIFCANELRRRVYVTKGKMPLRKKGQGRAIHVSDFIVEQTGRLTLSEEQLHRNATLPDGQRLSCTDSREIIYPGKNHDGFWTNDNLMKQIRNTILIFERIYPNAVAEFVFDQSSAHGAFAKDALNAKEMNVKPGGKQRAIHDTYIPMDNPHPELCGKLQKMNFPCELPHDHPDYEFRGQPKGMQRVLEERGLISVLKAANKGKAVGECQTCKLSREAQETLRCEALAAAQGGDEPDELHAHIARESLGVNCCMRKMLANQQDFKAEKPYIQLIIKAAGHKCWFLPKFHCELNPIEMYWGWVKTRFRSAADGTFLTAKRIVPELLDACPIKTIRAFYRKSWRYMDAYRKGLNARQAEFAVKKYKSHRRCGPTLMMNLGVLVD
ncbi:hypothetical protein P692DRAFT_201722673 [Suillus brevipes Sb2]|nr:hypothetical protein P692DRAFT_201722673 [Suillus brevipes Sb2]